MTLSELANKQDVLIHDVFNIVALSIFAPSVLVYLWHSTTWSPYWTPLPTYDPMRLPPTGVVASEQLDALAHFVLYAFVAYLVVDCIWISVVPSSVQTKPSVIILHHVCTLCLVAIPVLDRRWQWHGMIDLASEVNTLFLTIRRRFADYPTSAAYRVADVCFYSTWAVSRVYLFPVLAIYFSQLYWQLSLDMGTFFHLYAVGPALQLLLVAISAHWTYLLILNRGKAHPKLPPKAAAAEGAKGAKGRGKAASADKLR